MIDSHTKYLDTWAVEHIKHVTEQLNLVKGGMPDGKSYLDALPKTKKCAWKTFKEVVADTLGKSEVCAELDGKVASAHKAHTVLDRPNNTYTYIYLYIYIFVGKCSVNALGTRYKLIIAIL